MCYFSIIVLYCSSFMWVFPGREKQLQINELLPGQRLSRMKCCYFTIDLASVFHQCRPHISIWLSPLTQCNPDIIVRIIDQFHIWQHVRNGGLSQLWQFLACSDKNIFGFFWCNFFGFFVYVCVFIYMCVCGVSLVSMHRLKKKKKKKRIKVGVTAGMA